MASQIGKEFGWKQKAKHNATIGAKLFGVARNAHVETDNLRLSVLASARTAKDHEIRAEQEKARAAEFLFRRALIIQ